MRLKTRSDGHYAATLAAVYALVLHALLGVGGVAGLPTFQALCAFSETGKVLPLDAPASERHQIPPCCLVSAPTLSGPDNAPEPLTYPVYSRDSFHVVREDAAEGIGSPWERTPGDPRGPPLAV